MSSQDDRLYEYLLERVLELGRQLAAAQADKERETKRADAWVAAARDIARELGFEDDESDGSIKDWNFICSKLRGMKRDKELAVAMALKEAADIAYLDEDDSGVDPYCCLPLAKSIERDIRAKLPADTLAKLSELEWDAGRYRWLNSKHNLLISIEDNDGKLARLRLRCGEPLDLYIDRAIDAARTK